MAEKENFVNMSDIVKHFSISKRTLYRWQDAGMPVYKGPGGNKYLLSECIDWWNKERIKMEGK